MKNKGDHPFRDKAYELVLEELIAAREARRKVLQAALEQQLRIEFDDFEIRLRAWSGRPAEAVAPAPLSNSNSAVATTVVRSPTIGNASRSAEDPTLPVPKKETAKRILAILRESSDNVLTKSMAKDELAKRDYTVSRGSVLHAYEELSRLGLLEFLPPDRRGGEKKFRLASSYRPAAS